MRKKEELILYKIYKKCIYYWYYNVPIQFQFLLLISLLTTIIITTYTTIYHSLFLTRASFIINWKRQKFDKIVNQVKQNKFFQLFFFKFCFSFSHHFVLIRLKSCDICLFIFDFILFLCVHRTNDSFISKFLIFVTKQKKNTKHFDKFLLNN